MNMYGYETKTTFWQDFQIAEMFGGKAGVQDTFNRAFREWKTNTEYITEFVMVLNWRCWYWAGKDDDLGRLYEQLYYKAHYWCLDNLKGDDLHYYLRTTD